jgi:polar amino acid transport system substrate-binding protein
MSKQLVVNMPVILFFIVVNFFSQLTLASEVWVVVSEANSYPYNYWEKGKRTGLDAEIVDAILNDLGVTPVNHTMSWRDVVKSVDTGICDMAYQFTEYWGQRQSSPIIMVGPFRYGKTVLMTRNESNFDINSTEDLVNYRIGVVDGYRYTQDFDNNKNIEKLVSASTTVNLRRLLLNRVDLIIGDRDSLRATAELEGKLSQVKILPLVLGDGPRFFAFPYEKPEKAAQFEASFKKLKESGVLDGIYKNWIK